MTGQASIVIVGAGVASYQSPPSATPRHLWRGWMHNHK